MTDLLKTVLAKPYLFKRNGIYYLRLRARGATSDTINISLRTSDKTVSTEITEDILKRLAKFHLGEPSATWKQLKARMDDITPTCLAKVHGDASTAAYGGTHEGPISSKGFDDPESEDKDRTDESAWGNLPDGKNFEKVPAFRAPRFGTPVRKLRFSVATVSGTNKSGTTMLRPQGFEFMVGRDSSGTEVDALWYVIAGDLLTVTQDSYPKDAPEEQWDEMLTNLLEVQGCTKFQDIAPAPPLGKERDKWNAKRMARVDDLLTSYAERLKLRERTIFVFKLAEITGPIESTLMKAGDKAWSQVTQSVVGDPKTQREKP